MRSRVVMLAAAVAILVGGVLLVPSAVARLDAGDGRSDIADSSWHSASDPASASPSPSPSPVPATLAPRPVSVKVDGFVSWALLDRETGEISGAKNIKATNSTESMIKVWIVADYLRRVEASGKRPSSTRLAQGSRAIRDSDDSAAQALYLAGGADSVVGRMIKICGLTDTVLYPGWWSRTQISARDAVRMGNCIAEGRAAGPTWTKWVLTEMAKVRGTTAIEDQHATSGGGRWGIIDGLPREVVEQGVSIKNGWTVVRGDWHLNCLAIGRDWVLAVLMRYPDLKGLKYGAKVCAGVAKQLVVPGTAANR
jgi:hypothetical protein